MKILLWICLEKQYHTCEYCDNMIFSCNQNELATHHYIAMLPTNGLPLNYLFLQDSTWNLLENNEFYHLSFLVLSLHNFL
jgi:hypothetical protein